MLSVSETSTTSRWSTPLLGTAVCGWRHLGNRPSADETRAHAELKVMRHALRNVGSGFAAALIHAVTHPADELTLAEAASALEPRGVWTRLIRAH